MLEIPVWPEFHFLEESLESRGREREYERNKEKTDIAFYVD